MFPRNLKNRIALGKSYLFRRERLDAFPFEIAISLTNRCNLNCSFCPHRKISRRQGDISLELLESLIGQISPYADVVDLSFDGEPFLHPHWDEAVAICHRHQVRAIFQTNTLLMDEEVSRKIIATGLDAITLSIDAGTPETYRRLKPGGDYELMITNVEYFLELAGKSGKRPYITIQFVRSPDNQDEVELFKKRWKDRGADAIRIKPMLNFAGSVDSGFRGRLNRPCILLWTSLSIHWDGIVTLCCMEIEGRNMGDATRMPLREIVDNIQFQQMRKLHIAGRYAEHPICRGCDVPSVPWYFVLGSSLVDDMTRRRMVRLVQRYGFLQNKQ
jgi:pyruvate-formate lyase-activating enzyme